MELTRLERIDDAFISAISRVVWRRPARRILKMFEFSFTEEDSFRDMARAAELTDSHDLRPKYMLHALEEATHADLFRSRAAALVKQLEASGHSAAEVRQAMEKLRTGPVRLHEATHKNDLFESLGELEFLAFVYVAERRGAQQFRIYRKLLTDDPDSQAMFARIMNEEKFHMSYSRAALDKLAREGRRREVRMAIFRVRTRRYWQSWLRFCRRFADFSNRVLFSLIYFGLVGPTALLARPALPKPGWLPPAAQESTDLDTVRRQY